MQCNVQKGGQTKVYCYEYIPVDLFKTSAVHQMASLINLLKTKHNLLYIRNSPYRAVSTFHRG